VVCTAETRQQRSPYTAPALRTRLVLSLACRYHLSQSTTVTIAYQLPSHHIGCTTTSYVDSLLCRELIPAVSLPLSRQVSPTPPATGEMRGSTGGVAQVLPIVYTTHCHGWARPAIISRRVADTISSVAGFTAASRDASHSTGELIYDTNVC